MIFIREGEIFDAAEMATYSNLTRTTLGEFKLKPLVVYGNLESMEGEAPDGVVMLEFPSAEEAKSWYHSSAYQAAVEHRKKAAHYRVFMVEGV
jgi:uncharacterized protein (DUF1330 family)